MYIEKTCSVNLNYSMEICGNLTQGNYSEIQAEVHKHVSILQGVNGMLQAYQLITNQSVNYWNKVK